MDAIEKRFRPSIAREIARSMRWVVDGYEQTGAVEPDPEHQRNMQNILERQATAAVRVFAGRVLRAQKSDSMVVERKEFAQTMAKLAFRYIALEAFRRHIVDISETTRAQIINGVSRGFDEGLGQAGTARLIRDLVPSLARQRSQVIARTETHGAANYGSFGAARETGLDMRKEWVSAEDERTREDHDAMNGTTVGLDDYFDFGGYSLQYPGDPSGPAEGIINCRCSVAYVVAD